MQIYANICKHMQTYANICTYMQIYVRCPNFNFPELFGRFEFRILNSPKKYLGVRISNYGFAPDLFVGFSDFELIWKGITTEHFHCFREYCNQDQFHSSSLYRRHVQDAIVIHIRRITRADI